MLLHYFGENYHPTNCENCDNCNHPKTQFDGKDYIALALQAVSDVRERHKAEHVAKVLCGEVNSAIKAYRHHHLEIFGEGNEKDERFWNMVLRQALVAQLLSKDIENYGLLTLTESGKRFLEKPETFMLTEDHNYDEVDDQKAPRGSGAGAVDPELFSLLKDLRKKVAKKFNLPPFVIFQDPSLEDMAIYYPIRNEELANMTGVGLGKAQRYGSEFLTLIQKFVKEKEIERPQDMIVRSVVNKSSLKVSIIQSIDRKVPLDMIAESKGLDMDELLREIESIVNSGTRINIEYFINQVMDRDHQEEIYNYFREEAETESIEDALHQLGENDYSEEDIRLIRIKFMSEMGN